MLFGGTALLFWRAYHVDSEFLNLSTSEWKISLLEQKESIEFPLLQQIAGTLKIPVEAFQNFDEEKAINIISNSASFENCEQPAFFYHQPTFNPIDKMVELYERMLKEKEEMIEKLEKLIQEK